MLSNLGWCHLSGCFMFYTFVKLGLSFYLADLIFIHDSWHKLWAIYFVSGVIQCASLHWCSSILCTNSLYYLLHNSQNISSSLLPISLSFSCCQLIITSEGELLTNSGICTNHCFTWTLVYTKTLRLIFSENDWMINFHPSSSIFSIFWLLIQHSLGCDYAVDFHELFWIPSEIVTVPLLLNCKLPASVTIYNTWSTKMLKHIVQVTSNFCYTLLCRVQSEMNEVFL